MATNKNKEKEKEQTPAPAAPDTAEAPASPTVDPTEEAKKQAQAIIDAANAEAAKIVSDAKKQVAVTGNAQAQAQAEPETTSENDPMEELVDYFAPVILGKADQTIFCQVNGENIRIKRGVPVKIKRKFKMVLDQSAEQEMAAYAFMEEAQRGSAKALADL